MRAEALAEAVRAAQSKPVIVCAQAGNVNTGGFDPLAGIADAVDAHPNAWLHVDGAFGLWASAVPRLRHLVAGVERADSWSTDSHKWLNVGYDSGFVATRDPDAHRAAMATTAPYLLISGGNREPSEWVLDSSRRARGFALYAVLRSLGRDGVRDLVERCCMLARRIAEELSAAPGVVVLNEVNLNQVLVRFGDDDARTRTVIEKRAERGGGVARGERRGAARRPCASASATGRRPKTTSIKPQKPSFAPRAERPVRTPCRDRARSARRHLPRPRRRAVRIGTSLALLAAVARADGPLDEQHASGYYGRAAAR